MAHPLDPIAAADWDRRKARHLLNRAGFGAPLAEVDRLAALSPEKAVDSFLDYSSAPETLPEPEFLAPADAGRKLNQQIAALERLNTMGREPTEYDRQKMDQERMRSFNELQAKERQDVARLKTWWLRRMILTRRPLQEKMALFWHGHFATSAEKVNPAIHNYRLNKLFREMATGNFKSLTCEVGMSPAMLRYLDNDESNKLHPNENWARELMELFTMGKGNYSEDDIKNSARAFTGWTADGEKFVFNKHLHDDGPKTFLGKTGNFNGNDILDIIFDHPATAPFISRKLWVYFAYDDPEPEIVEGLAKTLLEGGYELRPALRRLLLSRAFYGDKAIATQVKSPAQVCVSLMAYLDVKPQPDSVVERYLAASLRAMGQDLFYPPNVKGWDGGRAWINTNTLMTRYNLSNFLVSGVASDVGPGTGIDQVLNRVRKKVAAAKQPPRKSSARMARAKEQMEAAMRESGEAEGGESMMMMSGGDEMMMGAAMDPALANMDMGAVAFVGDNNGPKGIKLPIAPFDAVAFFARADGVPVAKVVEHLADYFYGRPLSGRQQAEILDALTGGGNPATPMRAAEWDPERLRSAVRLMLSAAEFQVC